MFSCPRISSRSDWVNPDPFSSTTAGFSGSPITSPPEPCRPSDLIGAFHESQTAFLVVNSAWDFWEPGNFFWISLSRWRRAARNRGSRRG